MANDIRLRISDAFNSQYRAEHTTTTYPDFPRSKVAINAIFTDASIIDILQLFGISRDLLSPLSLRYGGCPEDVEMSSSPWPENKVFDYHVISSWLLARL